MVKSTDTVRNIEKKYRCKRASERGSRRDARQ